MTTNKDNTTRPATSGGDQVRTVAKTGDDGTIVKKQVAQLSDADAPITEGKPLIVSGRSALRSYGRILSLAALAHQGLIGPPPSAGLPIAAASSSLVTATLQSANFTVGDTQGGGQSIVFQGLACDTITTFYFDYLGGGQVAATITAQTPTSITVTLPPHASGVVSCAAINVAGASNTLSFEYWTPAQIVGVDRYFDANKGVTLATAPAISTVTDQVASAVWTASTNAPTQVASVFGTLPSMRFSNALGEWMQADVARDFGTTPSSWSAFFVGITTTNAPTAAAPAYNAPLTAIGWSGRWSGFGLVSGDELGQGQGTPNQVVSTGLSLNDGAARLIGFTCNNVTGDAVAYVGGQSQASANNGGATPFLYGCDRFGAGCATLTTAGGDGWDGDIGAVIIVAQIIAGGDLTKLNQWSQQRFGTP